MKKKRIVVLLTSLCVCFCTMINCLEVDAAINYVFQVPYAEPSTSDTQGYLNVFYEDASGNMCMQTWFWVISPYYGSLTEAEPNSHSNSRMGLHVDYDAGSIKFTPSVDYTQTGSYVLFCYDNGGNLYCMGNTSFTSNTSYTYTSIGSSGLTIKAVIPYGNIGSFTQTSNPNNQYSVIYSGDAVEYQQMQETLQLIGQMQNTLQNVASNTNKANLYLLQGKTSLANLEVHAQTLISQMDEVNLKLDSIDSHLEDLYNYLAGMSADDADVVDDLRENSNNQSDKLNSMNEQTKVEQIDIDSASSTIDSNLDVAQVSNYGAILSSITLNNQVVKMMLAVLSISLIGYVLFGKR